MKKTLKLMLIIIFSVSHFSTSADAAEGFKKISGFMAGALAGFAGHELGHQLMATTIGKNLQWSGSHWKFKNKKMSKDSKSAIYSAGFVSQIIGSELVLRKKNYHDNSFFLGYLMFNITNSIKYSFSHECHLLKKGEDDIRGLERRSGIPGRYIEAIIIGHALFTGYRIYRNSTKSNTILKFWADDDRIFIGLQWNF